MNGVRKFGLAVTVAAGLAAIAGCGSDGTSSSSLAPEPTTAGGPLVGGGATAMYVVQNNTYNGTNANGTVSYNVAAADVILKLNVAATGAVTPAAALSTPTGMFVAGVATDAAGNLYAGGFDIATSLGEIAVYAAGSTGSAAPTRLIIGATTGLNRVQGITVDSAGQIYVSSYYSRSAAVNAISVFSGAANGNVAPVRSITGSTAGLVNPSGVAVDSTGTIYVADGTISQVYAFNAAANGNVQPTRTFTTAYTPVQIAVDSANNIYLALANAAGTYGAVNVFPSTATGTLPAPARIVGGQALAATSGILGMALDSQNNLYAVYVKNSSSLAIATFSPTATGNAVPAATYSTTSYTSTRFGYIAVR